MKKYIKIMMFAITLLGSFYTGLAIAGRYRASNAYMLATVLWHEARNIGYVEMQKVANVAMNRYSKFAGNSKDGYELEIGDILTASGAFDGSPAYLNARMTNDDILITGKIESIDFEKTIDE